MKKIDDDLRKKWNYILAREGMETVQVGKATKKTKKDQYRSKKRGLPSWAKRK